jgi:hypothetical protein
MTNHGVVLFYTSSAAMRSEKVLLKDGYNIKMIPTPRELSSDCGIALRFDWQNHESIKQTLIAAMVEFDSIHRM